MTGRAKKRRDPPSHGTDAGRQWHRARGERPCVDCQQATTSLINALRKRVREQGLDPDDPRHGTFTAYSSYGCRCEPCLQAGRNYRAGFRANHRSVVNVAPRLRSVRVSADVWDAAKELTAERGDTMPGIIEAALRRYIARHRRQ